MDQLGAKVMTWWRANLCMICPRINLANDFANNLAIWLAFSSEQMVTQRQSWLQLKHWAALHNPDSTFQPSCARLTLSHMVLMPRKKRKHLAVASNRRARRLLEYVAINDCQLNAVPNFQTIWIFPTRNWKAWGLMRPGIINAGDSMFGRLTGQLQMWISLHSLKNGHLKIWTQYWKGAELFFF